MYPTIKVQALRESEIAKIHAAMVAILSRTGLVVEHAAVREAYAGYGAEVDRETQRVRFPERVINRFLEETEPAAYPSGEPFGAGGPALSLGVAECYRPLCPNGNMPTLTVRSGVSLSAYLEPGTNRVTGFTEETLGGYIKLARLLDSDIVVRLETLPVGDGRVTQPLEGRIFAWKRGAWESGGVQMTELCPYLLDMYQIRAEALDRPLSEVFCGSVYVISPLRIPRDVCEQILFFHRHGLRVRIGNMITPGGSGPVTLAGSLALNLAERVAIGILERVLYGEKGWVIYGEIAPLDMKTLAMPSGRPEILLLNLAVIQLARHYGVPAHPFGGYTDARVPSTEAGMQKVMTALPCILAGGCNVDAGRLGGSTCSPIQMILDSELIRALRRVLRGFAVDDDTLAVDLIDEVGPGGSFLAAQHTVRYLRTELWQPGIWSPAWFQSQTGGDTRTDVERAFALWQDLMSRPDPEPGISEETERRLQAVVDSAARNL